MPISGSTGSFTSMASTGTIAAGTWQGNEVQDAYVSNSLTITGGSISNVGISGGSGSFTTLSASSTVSFGGFTLSTTGKNILSQTSTGNAINYLSTKLKQIHDLNCADGKILGRQSSAWACLNDGRRRRRLLTSDSDDVHADSEEMRKNIVHFDSSSESASDMLSKLDVYSYEYEPTPTSITEDEAVFTNVTDDEGVQLGADRHFGISPGQLKSELPHVLTANGFHAPSLQAFMIQAIKEIRLENQQMKEKIQQLEQKIQTMEGGGYMK